MLAKKTILDKWQLAVTQHCALTFINTYGWQTAHERYQQTNDLFSREDDIGLIKSIEQLRRDLPLDETRALWPGYMTLMSISQHILDDDYPHRLGVDQYMRDPNINMYSEEVAPDDNIQEDGLPAPDLSFDELTQEDDDAASGYTK